MIQRLHLAYSPSRRCFALVISSRRVRLWMMPEVDIDEIGPQEMASAHALDLETQGSGIVGVEFLDDHTLLCVHHDGVLQGWSLKAEHDSVELLSTPLHGEFEPSLESSNEETSDAMSEMGSAFDEESPLAAVSSLPRPRVEFTRLTDEEAVVGHGLSATLSWRFELGMRLESCVFWHSFQQWESVRVAMGTPTGQIVLAEVKAEEEPQTYTLNGHGGAVSVMSFNADGTVLASSSRKRDICLWRADSTSPIQTPWRVLTGAEGEVWSLAFSPSSRYLVSGGIDNSVYYWDILAQRPLRAVSKDHEGWIADLAWSEDERVVASASWDNTVGLFRNGDMAPLYCFDFHEDYVVQVLFVPHSNYLVSAGYDQRIAVWDWRNAQLVTRLDAHKDWVQHLCWVGNGMMASASSDKQVRLWSLETLACQYVLTQRSDGEDAMSSGELSAVHQPLVHQEGFGVHRVSHRDSEDSAARARAALESARFDVMDEVSVLVDDAPSSILSHPHETPEDHVHADSLPIEPPVDDVDLAFGLGEISYSDLAAKPMPDVNERQAQVLANVEVPMPPVEEPSMSIPSVSSAVSDDWESIGSSLFEDSESDAEPKRSASEMVNFETLSEESDEADQSDTTYIDSEAAEHSLVELELSESHDEADLSEQDAVHGEDSSAKVEEEETQHPRRIMSAHDMLLEHVPHMTSEGEMLSVEPSTAEPMSHDSDASEDEETPLDEVVVPEEESIAVEDTRTVERLDPPIASSNAEEVELSDELDAHGVSNHAQGWSDTLYESGERELSEVMKPKIQAVEVAHLVEGSEQLDTPDAQHEEDSLPQEVEPLNMPQSSPELEPSASQTIFGHRVYTPQDSSLIEESIPTLEKGSSIHQVVPSGSASELSDANDASYPDLLQNESGQVPVGDVVLNTRSSGFVMLDEFSTPEQLSDSPVEESQSDKSDVEIVHTAKKTAEQFILNASPQEEQTPEVSPVGEAADADESFVSLDMLDGVISDMVSESKSTTPEAVSEQPVVAFSRDAVKSAFLRRTQEESPAEEHELSVASEQEVAVVEEPLVEQPVGSEQGVDQEPMFPGMPLNQIDEGHVPDSWATTEHDFDPVHAHQAIDASQTMFGFQGLIQSGLVQEESSSASEQKEGLDGSSDVSPLTWEGPGVGESMSLVEQGEVFDRAETVANASPLTLMRDASTSASASPLNGAEFSNPESSCAPLRMPRLDSESFEESEASSKRKSLDEHTRPGEDDEGPIGIRGTMLSHPVVSNQTIGFGSPMASGLVHQLRAHHQQNQVLPSDVCDTFELTPSEIWQMRLAERKPAMQIFKRRRAGGVYRPQERLESHHNSIQDVVYCEQGKFFAVSGDQQLIEVWSPRRGRLGCLTTHESVACINATQDGRVVVAGCESGQIHMWLIPVSIGSLSEASIGKVMLEAGAAVQSVSFDIHGRYLMAGLSNGNTIVWDMADGHEHARLLHHSGGVLATEFDNNGPITGCEDNILRFWSMDAQVQGLIGGVGQLVDLKADTRGLYALNVNGLLHHYQGNEHRQTYTYDQHPIAFAFSSSGVFVVACHRGEVSIHPKGIDSEAQVLDLGHDLSSVAAAGPLVVVGTKDGHIEILKRQ